MPNILYTSILFKKTDKTWKNFEEAGKTLKNFEKP